MKAKTFLSLLLLSLLPFAGIAQQKFLNLTPRPLSGSLKTGTLTLPETFTISVAGLPDSLITEAEKFARAFNDVSGYNATVSADADGALFTVTQDLTLKDEGYKAEITADGVALTAKTATGLYYAFQTVKKLLPANVMAGVKDASVTAYTIPLASINDRPRFAYRGFMLDVARHFFTVEEVKRMINVMSFYKLNRFHWHLSDDQGWRVEIKKYPKLTTVGATAPNSRFTSMTEGQYWINKPYGPYYYTQDEIREVVAYAAERHIEVIPEIDMPGHFCAALAAYPEFSCTPTEAHSVQTDGGIYSDILNVANPDAVQFTKDVLSELMELFPSKYIHIGGDECPTTAWESNAECQAQYAALGLTSYRQLQSHFIKELSDFVQKKGRTLAIWNEGITATGADTDLMKETGALVYCWISPEAAVTKAQSLGLSRIYTPWGPYYINRKQSSDANEPAGAGDGTDHVKKTYNTVPPTATDAGVQGTFWTEHVSDREYMEYLALPRLLAIAEAGWTQAGLKNFDNFQKRMTADTVLLNYGGYRYCKYYMVGEATSPSAPATPDVAVAAPLKNGHTYRFRNAVDGFDKTALVDNGVSTALRHSTETFVNDAWTVADSVTNDDGTQSFTLQNAATGRYVAATTAYVACFGKAANVGTTAATVTLKHDFADDEYRLTVGDASLFPLPESTSATSNTISAGSTTSSSADAARSQGATWTVEEVRVVTLHCVDDTGKELGTYVRSVPVTTSEITAELCPVLKGYSVVKVDSDAGLVTYHRDTFAVTLESRDTHGSLIAREESAVPAGQTYTVVLPTLAYYTLVSATSQAGDCFVPAADTTITATFSTDAIAGVKALGHAVTTLQNGKSYIFYDAVSGSNANRAGFRRIVSSTNAINKFNAAEDLDSTAIWTLEGSGKTFKVKNDYLGLYVPQLKSSTATTAAKTGTTFTFSLNDDGETWAIKGDNNLYWDGLASGALVGWGQNNGHPIRIYEFFVEPLYALTIICTDEDGQELTTTTTLLPAGEAYTITYPTIDDYVFTSATGDEDYAGTIEGHLVLNATYAKASTGIATVEREERGTATGIYDLQGRRLNAVSGAGIYIKNGKKVIFK